jgi:hypothetical protein
LTSKVAATLHAAGKHAERMSLSTAAARTPFGPSAVFLTLECLRQVRLDGEQTLIDGTPFAGIAAVAEKVPPARRLIC